MRTLRCWLGDTLPVTSPICANHPQTLSTEAQSHGPLQRRRSAAGRRRVRTARAGHGGLLLLGLHGVRCPPLPPGKGVGAEGRPPGPLPKAAFGGGPRGPKRASFPAPSLGMGPGAPWPGPEDCPVCPRGLGWDGPSPIPGRESPASGSGIAPIAWAPLFLGLCYWPEGKTDTQHSPTRPANLSVVLPTTRQLCS